VSDAVSHRSVDAVRHRSFDAVFHAKCRTRSSSSGRRGPSIEVSTRSASSNSTRSSSKCRRGSVHRSVRRGFVIEVSTPVVHRSVLTRSPSKVSTRSSRSVDACPYPSATTCNRIESTITKTSERADSIVEPTPATHSVDSFLHPMQRPSSFACASSTSTCCVRLNPPRPQVTCPDEASA